MLAARGMDVAAAGRAATGLLDRVVIGQSTVIAFDTAFNAVALLFVFAAPMLVAFKVGLHRYAKMHAASPADEIPAIAGGGIAQWGLARVLAQANDNAGSRERRQS